MANHNYLVVALSWGAHPIETNMGASYKLKHLLDAGSVAFGAVNHIPAPALIEILGRAGYDFTIIDTEHGLYDLETSGELIRAAQGAGLSALVRVLRNDPVLIMKALDLGAEGIVVPHVSSKDEAVRAVAACKYGPGGSRGACPLVRAADYGLSDWKEFQDEASRNTMLILLIEDLEGAAKVEEIASVPGVDGIFLGAFDMSVAAGHKGNVEHPEVQRALDRILACCRERGIPVMHTATNGRDIEAWVRKGVRLVVQSADSAVFARACKAFLDSVSHLRKSESAVVAKR